MFRTLVRPALIACLIISSLADRLPGDERRVLSQLNDSLKRYSTADAWGKRRAELRREFLKGAQLWPLPDRPPVNAIIHSLRKYKGYTVENVALETLPGFYCTGNLYRPLNRKELGPAILCPHGHFRPLGRYRENHQIRCAHLAQMGATVFSYSMVGWQDSQQTTHDDPLVLALQTWNSLRAVDFVSGLERVDANRVGVTGASGGGTQSLFLALIDDRVKASAPLVIVYPWAAPQGCLCEGGMPVMKEADTNSIELAAATSPRPQLLISVGNDPTQNFPTVGFPFIERMYRVAGSAKSVQNIHLADEGHDFGPSKRKAVYEFFARHLRMTRNAFLAFGEKQPQDLDLLKEDLTRITIEKPEQMQVFGEKRPLPNHALKGSDAIAAAFKKHLNALRQLQKTRTTSLKDAPRAEYSFKAAGPEDEALIFTPAGFDKRGVAKVAGGPDTGKIEILVRDDRTDKPTFCRINVVGADGNYYQPDENDLKAHSLTGVWPNSGWGNRQGKAPIRYLGHYFYSSGKATVAVPAGAVRVEVWKGFEYRPTTLTTQVSAGKMRRVELTLEKSAAMSDEGYWSGDPHIHIQRFDAADEKRILDLLAAEDIHFGTTLAYNDPPGPYAGFMNRMDSPQLRGMGKRSILSRGGYSVLSGEEYRSGAYGHLNLFLLDELVMPGLAYNADGWPPFGHVALKARERGGLSFYAHGGYAKEIYADVVQGNVDGVELLQFGVYRGIGLTDWYRMLNVGFRVPATGACDYPACRKLGDCKTYVYGNKKPDMQAWLQGMAAGRSFFTSGPLVLLEVDGQRPGSRIDARASGSIRVTARVRVRSEVAAVTNVQLIVNGRVLNDLKVPAGQGRGNWIQFEQEIELDRSAWIAARAFSLSRLGTPDAESHTNPVYVYFNGKAPYDQNSLDAILEKLDGQMDKHRTRDFKEKSRVLDYFQKSRDLLLKIRADKGMASTARPVPDNRLEIDASDSEITEKSLKNFLKPLPPQEPQQSLKTFESANGFAMQIVAAEPFVHDPIAATFDEEGNLYVTEMLDYPYHPLKGEKPIGRVRFLRDTNHDGTFDESHIFAEELLWAGGVVPWEGGVYVASPPSIWYLKDTDGDFKADIRREVFTGFGDGNQQAMVNNLKFSLDHKIYGATAGNGGDIVTVAKPDQKATPLNGRDFRFDPRTEKFETVTGTVQFGNTFDDWGNRFMCSQGVPGRQEVLPQRYLERNPALAVSKSMEVVAPAGIQIYRTSPIEAWRQIRVARRRAKNPSQAASTGSTHHVIDASAGTTVYRGDAYPAEYYGNLFIGCGQNNLVHRRKLVPKGVTFQTERLEYRHEFMRSTDIWFRPVNFVNAPDGTLYCLDMAREFLESIHIPLDVVKHLDLTSGRDRGRIYRMAPPGFQYPGTPRLDTANFNDLLTALTSRNGWKRDTAHRLIYQRQEHSIVPSLKKIATTHDFPQARLHALWSLEGLQELNSTILGNSLNDPHPRIREHAVRLSEPFLNSNKPLLNRVLELSSDNDDRVRFQVAFSLGEADSPAAIQTLAAMARRDAANYYLRTAILSSVPATADQLFGYLWNDAKFAESEAGKKMLQQLVQVVGSRAKTKQVVPVLSLLATAQQQPGRARAALRLFDGLSQALIAAGFRVMTLADLPEDVRIFLKELIQNDTLVVLNEKLKPEQRQQALGRLASASYEKSADTWSALIERSLPATLKTAVVRTLGGYADERVSSLLLEHWREFTPEVRTEALNVLLARETSTVAFLRAAEQEKVSVTAIEEPRRQLLLKHRNSEIVRLAEKLIGQMKNSPRNQVVEEYQRALKLTGNPTSGRQTFSKTCANCHKVGDQGANNLGPDLMGTLSQDSSRLVEHILDPNRYVPPKFVQYVVVDKNGRTYTGMISDQNVTSVTLRRDKNETDTILRGNIDEMLSTGISLMPEGLEKTLTPQDLANLIAFLHQEKRTLDRKAQKAATRQARDFGTIPGFVAPD
jgi:putative membrane-bound dehydrogenase-like protein